MLDALIGFAVGILSSMGFGGGSILLLYLTLVKDTEHKAAAGINLLFFLPCAALSTFFYVKKKMIEAKHLGPLMIFSALGATGGSIAAMFIGVKWIRIAFGVLLLIIGLRELFSKQPPKANQHNSEE